MNSFKKRTPSLSSKLQSLTNPNVGKEAVKKGEAMERSEGDTRPVPAPALLGHEPLRAGHASAVPADVFPERRSS